LHKQVHKKARKEEEEEESKPREGLGVETEQEDREKRREVVRGLRLWWEGLDFSN
jgi:hypothetical protein